MIIQFPIYLKSQAKACLHSYFQALGVPENEALKQIKAYYTFSVLRNIAFQKWNKLSINYDIVDRNIEQINGIKKLEEFP